MKALNKILMVSLIFILMPPVQLQADCFHMVEWREGTRYALGQVVYVADNTGQRKKYYRCIMSRILEGNNFVDHRSSSQNRPGTGTRWRDFWQEITCEVHKTPRIRSVMVQPEQAIVIRGRTRTQQFNVIVDAVDGASERIVWTTDANPFGTSINNNGLLTIGAREEREYVTIKATSTFDRRMHSFATVNVINEEPQSSPNQRLFQINNHMIIFD